MEYPLSLTKDTDLSKDYQIDFYTSNKAISYNDEYLAIIFESNKLKVFILFFVSSFFISIFVHVFMFFKT